MAARDSLILAVLVTVCQSVRDRATEMEDEMCVYNYSIRLSQLFSATVVFRENNVYSLWVTMTG